MSKETNEFLENECMKVIIELTEKYPNDMDLGVAVRSFINSAKSQQMVKNQLNIDFNLNFENDLDN